MSQPRIEVIPGGHVYGVFTKLPAVQLLALWKAHVAMMQKLDWHFIPEDNQAAGAVTILNQILEEDPDATVQMIVPTRGGGIAQ
jgi:hypothetical protein